MAEFYLIGNKWFDDHMKHFCNFTGELKSPACHASPLIDKDIEALERCMTRISNISKSIRKRINKKKK